MINKRSFRPTHYTSTEISNEWKEYDNDWCFDVAWLNRRDRNAISVCGGLKIHALAFDNPAMGHGNFIRWDSVNGFNSQKGW
jgi:hypothetical protein